MNKRIEHIAWLTDQEFHGQSFNSKSLLITLESLSMEQVTMTDTLEGYTVWEIALHVASWKWLLADILGGNPRPWPYQREDWPKLDTVPTKAVWEKIIDDLIATHHDYMKTLEGLSDEKLDEEHEEWKIPHWQFITWMSSHDVFHGAQIRNMGIGEIKYTSD